MTSRNRAHAEWLARDPLPDAERGQVPNLYGYVANDPIVKVDPLGLCVGGGGGNFEIGLFTLTFDVSAQYIQDGYGNSAISISGNYHFGATFALSLSPVFTVSDAQSVNSLSGPQLGVEINTPAVGGSFYMGKGSNSEGGCFTHSASLTTPGLGGAIGGAVIIGGTKIINLSGSGNPPPPPSAPPPTGGPNDPNDPMYHPNFPP